MLIGLAALLGATMLVYLMFIVPTQWLKIERVHVGLGLGIRILQISDLHVDRLRISAAKLATIIHTEMPDYILLTGDYTYKPRFLSKVDRYLGEIVRAGIPVYAVLGNHDYALPRPRELIDLFRKHGITVLRNSRVELQSFTLIGIDNYSTGHSRVELSFRGVRRTKPLVVITHDPNVVLEIRQSYDYLMAGHMHGKQFNVPYFYSIKPKGPLSQKGIYKGLHRGDYGVYYISKGIGQAGVNARFMVRSEVTLHEL
ncbi:metallophosphoesterase [Paenibacillus sp. strain BS8-2]